MKKISYLLLILGLIVLIVNLFYLFSPVPETNKFVLAFFSGTILIMTGLYFGYDDRDQFSKSQKRFCLYAIGAAVIAIILLII